MEKTIDNRDEIVVDDDKLLEELEELEKEENPSVEEEEETEEETKIEKKPEKSQAEIDLEAEKERYKASRQEAMVLKAKLDEIEAEKNKPIVIDDDYMKANYKDWEDMTTTEQMLAKGLEETKQQNKELISKTNEYNNDRKWREQIDELVNEPEFIDKFPKMKGKEEEFKKFCSRPTRKGMDTDTLASAFLFEFKEPDKEVRTLFKETDHGEPKEEKKGLTIDESIALRKGSNSQFMNKLKDKNYDPLAGL